MITEGLNTKELFQTLDTAIENFLVLFLNANKNLYDVVPFESSWTIAQLASHVTKSNKAIAQALEMPGSTAQREADHRVEELKKIFLNFETKFQSPEFILPTNTIYPKGEVIKKLADSFDKIKELRTKVNLSEVISLPLFGEITKFELLNFIVFHTTRHARQLENIVHTLHSKN